MHKFLKDLFTGADNATYAIGRVLGAAFALVGVPPPFMVAAFMAAQAHETLAEWGNFFAAVGAYEVAVMGAVAGLIRITHGAEPKPGDAQ